MSKHKKNPEIKGEDEEIKTEENIEVKEEKN
jgi:hypothetical protein